MLTPFYILVILALLFTIGSLIWPSRAFLLPIAVLFLAIALLIGAHSSDRRTSLLPRAAAEAAIT